MRLPRLSRRQRVLRNLLLALAAALVIWYGYGFRAPSLGLALRWEAQAYMLPETPELLYASPAARNGGRELVGRCGGRWFFTTDYPALFFHRVTQFTFTEPSEPVTCIVPPFGGDDVLYAATKIPGAAEAECRVRFQGGSSGTVNGVPYSFDWDETYVSRGTANENGVYRFPLERKYQDVDDARRTAEWGMFDSYHIIPRVKTIQDFRCTAQLIFYSEAGAVLAREELVLYDGSA